MYVFKLFSRRDFKELANVIVVAYEPKIFRADQQARDAGKRCSLESKCDLERELLPFWGS